MSRQHILARLLALLLLACAASAPRTAPALAAEPGAELVSFSGSLNADIPARTVPLAESGPANLKLTVSGGAAADSVTLSLLNASGGVVRSWVARSGETIWGFADLPAGARLRLQTSGAALSFDLRGYARGSLLAPHAGATSWSGVAVGAAAASTRSAVQLVAPSSGLYRLTLSAAGGGFQLLVGENHIRKTAVSGKLPAAADTVYYLAAGVHTLQILQDPTAGVSTAWSVQMAAAGALDSLPYGEAAAVLGGGAGGGSFAEEWAPIQVAAGQPVNLRIQASGAAADSLQVELYNGTTRVYSTTAVFGGEVLWGSAQLAAGANALRVVAKDDNGAPLAYSVSVSPLPAPELSWSGVSYGASPANSTIKLTVTKDGLYRFVLGASAGRYQLRLNNTALQKIVTPAGADFTAFVPAGTHTLVLDQDSAANTSWSVRVVPAAPTADTLPFTRGGATLGGAGRDFREEWLPIRLGAAAPVNLKVTASGGEAGDSLQVQLYRPGSATPAYSAANVFSGEVFWATSELVSGTNLLRVSAAADNAAPMSYTVEIVAVGGVPATLSGVSLGGGLNPAFTLRAPADGVYTLVMTMTAGAGLVLVDPPQGASRSGLEATPLSSSLTLRVPLKAGPHRLVLQQDPAEPRTEWQISLRALQPAAALTIAEVTPGFLAPGAGGQIEVTGTGFESGTTVSLVSSQGAATALSTVVVSGTRLTAAVPAGLPAGSYTLRLSSPGGASATRAAALSVGQLRLYLPLLSR